MLVLASVVVDERGIFCALGLRAVPAARAGGVFNGGAAVTGSTAWPLFSVVGVTAAALAARSSALVGGFVVQGSGVRPLTMVRIEGVDREWGNDIEGFLRGSRESSRLSQPKTCEDT